eukprot:654100-Amphidinium_carterae.2
MSQRETKEFGGRLFFQPVYCGACVAASCCNDSASRIRSWLGEWQVLLQVNWLSCRYICFLSLSSAGCKRQRCNTAFTKNRSTTDRRFMYCGCKLNCAQAKLCAQQVLLKSARRCESYTALHRSVGILHEIDESATGGRANSAAASQNTNRVSFLKERIEHATVTLKCWSGANDVWWSEEVQSNRSTLLLWRAVADGGALSTSPTLEKQRSKASVGTLTGRSFVSESTLERDD